jgi:hypothetical protein
MRDLIGGLSPQEAVMASGFILFASLLVVAGLTSCGSDNQSSSTSTGGSGVGGAGGAGGAGGSVDAGFGSSGCGQCVKEACAGVISECDSDPGCSAYLQCVYACPVAADGNVDPVCAVKCPKGSGSATEEAISNLTECRLSGPGASSCEACGIPETVATDGNPILNQMCAASADPNPCFKCEDENCCDTYKACAEDPECQAFKDCLKVCFETGKDTCTFDCYMDHPEGVTHFAPRLTCLLTFCAEKTACNNEEIDPCIKCSNVSCAEEFADYNGDPMGYLFGECISLCPTADKACHDACADSYPSAAILVEPYSACMSKNCGAECG